VPDRRKARRRARHLSRQDLYERARVREGRGEEPAHDEEGYLIPANAVTQGFSFQS